MRRHNYQCVRRNTGRHMGDPPDQRGLFARNIAAKTDQIRRSHSKNRNTWRFDGRAFRCGGQFAARENSWGFEQNLVFLGEKPLSNGAKRAIALDITRATLCIALDTKSIKPKGATKCTPIAAIPVPI